MALINCPDCNRQVSDSAPSCPNCGRIIAGKNLNIGITTSGQNKSSWFKKIGIGIIIIFSILYYIGIFIEDSPKEVKTVVSRQVAPVFVTSVGELCSAYEDNTVAADMKFKGKRFRLQGIVSSINTDLFGSPYITLQSGNRFTEPHFSFAASAKSALSTLKKGENVNLVCTGRGDIAKTPMSDDCSLLLGN